MSWRSCTVAPQLSASRRNSHPNSEDPEDEKKIGLWFDQGISTPFSGNKSLDVEFHERLDEGASNLFEYFGQASISTSVSGHMVHVWCRFIVTSAFLRIPPSTYEKPAAFARCHHEHITWPVEADPPHAHRGTLSR